MFEAAEKRVNRSGSISYWKDDVLIGKRCTKCGEDKEITDFSKKNGVYKAICKKCKNSDLSKWRKKQPKKTKKYINEDGVEVRIYGNGNITYWENNVLVGRRCTKCGEDKEVSEFFPKSSVCKKCRNLIQKEQRAKEKRYINEDGLEVEVNKRYGTITYWKEGVIVGRRCNKCGEDKEISQFRVDKNRNCYRATCKSCDEEYNKRYKKENIESIRIQVRKYREKNYERLEEKRKQYMKENAEHFRQYRKENAEHIRERNKLWASNNREKVNKIAKRRREKVKRNNITEITKMLHQINPILEEFNIDAYGCIYKVTNIKTGRCYIGQTVRPLNVRYCGDIIERWIEERKMYEGQKFLEEINKKEDFVIDRINYGICQYHLDKLEVYYINKYDSYNNGYNNNSGYYKTDDGLEEFQQILSTHNLEYKDGKIIKKPTSTNEID